MSRNGKTLRQRFEELGFDASDSDEATHDALDILELTAFGETVSRDETKNKIRMLATICAVNRYGKHGKG